MNELSRVSGADRQAIRHFLRRGGDMKVATADRLAFALGLHIVRVQPGPRIDQSRVPPDSLKAVIDELHKAGVASGLSAYALARKASLSHSTISRFLSGEHCNLGYITVAKLALALGFKLGPEGLGPLTSRAQLVEHRQCPVELFGPSRPSKFGGVEAKKPLTPAEFDIIKAMVDLHDSGKVRNPEEVIAKRSGRTNPIRTLRRLRKSPFYRPYIKFPGKRGLGGYGLGWPDESS